MIPFFGDLCQRGESMSPKQKDHTTTLILKLMIFNWQLQIGILLCSKGEEVSIFKSDILKPSWTLREEFIEGEFCLVKGKAFETGGENFKSWKMLREILFIYLWLFAKRTLKRIYKRIFKTKLVVQAWSKM
jgi:hypothetical protein